MNVKYELEIKQLSMKTKEMKENSIEELKQLEDWSFTHFKSVIFDSECCNWARKSSTFDKRLMNKSHVIIMIETKDTSIKFV